MNRTMRYGLLAAMLAVSVSSVSPMEAPEASNKTNGCWRGFVSCWNTKFCPCFKVFCKTYGPVLFKVGIELASPELAKAVRVGLYTLQSRDPATFNFFVKLCNSDVAKKVSDAAMKTILEKYGLVDKDGVVNPVVVALVKALVEPAMDVMSSKSRTSSRGPRVRKIKEAIKGGYMHVIATEDVDDGYHTDDSSD